MSSDNRLIAARYIQALFDLASENKQHDQVKTDMQMLKSVLNSVEFQKLLVNPVMTREASEDAIGKVLTAIKAGDLTKRFFALLARNRRLAVTPYAVDLYLDRLAEARGELTVHVTSAQALSAEDTKVIAAAVAKSTGKKVEIRARENRSLIGGLQVRVGSKMFDNSIASKLTRLGQALTEAA